MRIFGIDRAERSAIKLTQITYRHQRGSQKRVYNEQTGELVLAAALGLNPESGESTLEV